MPPSRPPRLDTGPPGLAAVASAPPPSSEDQPRPSALTTPASTTVLPHPSRPACRRRAGPHYPPSYAAALPAAPPVCPAADGLERAAASVALILAAGVSAAGWAAGWAASAASARTLRPAGDRPTAASLLALAALAPPLSAAAATAAVLRSMLTGEEDHTAGPAAGAADNGRVHALVCARLACAGALARAAVLAGWAWVYACALPLALLAPAALRGVTTATDAAAASAFEAAAARAGSAAAAPGPVVPALASSYWRVDSLRSLYLAARADAVARGLDAAAARPWRPSPFAVPGGPGGDED